MNGRTRRGAALAITLCAALLLVTMGLSVMSLAGTSKRLSNQRVLNAQALSLAQGGLDDGAAQLKHNAAFTGYGPVTIGPGSLTVTVTVPAGYPSRRLITSTARTVCNGQTASRSVQAVLSNSAGANSLFYNALASKASIGLNGNVTINSSPTQHLGNVQTNGDISISGSAATIDGSATATGTYSTSGHPTVTGAVTTGAPPMDMPVIDSTFEQGALADGSSTGNLVVTDGSLVKGQIVGNLNVRGPLGCMVNGLVWVTGNLTVNGPVTGNGTIVCDGTLKVFATNGVVPPGVSNVIFATTSANTVTLGGNANAEGIIYAPNAAVKLSGNPSLLGGVIANSLTFSGTPTITRYTAFDFSKAPLPGQYQLLGYQE